MESELLLNVLDLPRSSEGVEVVDCEEKLLIIAEIFEDGVVVVVVVDENEEAEEETGVEVTMSFRGGLGGA